MRTHTHDCLWPSRLSSDRWYGWCCVHLLLLLLCLCFCLTVPFLRRSLSSSSASSLALVCIKSDRTVLHRPTVRASRQHTLLCSASVHLTNPRVLVSECTSPVQADTARVSVPRVSLHSHTLPTIFADIYLADEMAGSASDAHEHAISRLIREGLLGRARIIY